MRRVYLELKKIQSSEIIHAYVAYPGTLNGFALIVVMSNAG